MIWKTHETVQGAAERGRRSGTTAEAKWIGTGGKSPFGAYGTIRAASGWAVSRGCSPRQKVASERRFKNYRNDIILDVRQTKLALKKLRELKARRRRG